MVGKAQFDINVGTKVLAYHGPLIYEAKVLKSHFAKSKYVETEEGNELLEECNLPPHTSDTDMFMLHYKGWKNKWDEWVVRDRVMEFNEENINKMKTLIKEKNDRRKKASSPATATATGKVGKKSNGPPRLAPKEDFKLKKKKQDIILPMSQKLKYLLVDDWELITKDRKIVSVPCKKPVSVILQDYLQYSKSKRTPEELNVAKEVVAGLSQYFNEATRLILFYKYERLQYGNLLKKQQNMDLCEIYGLEHLLRLFVSLPGLVADTAIDAKSLEVMMRECSNILDFLDLKFMNYINDYENTTPAYDNLARS